MGLRYTALYLPAESTTKETTATVAVDVATTATATVVKATTAALTSAPATEAAGERVQPTTAALTVTPTTEATGERVAGGTTHNTTADLTVTVTAEATAGGSTKSTTASLTVSPATDATGVRAAETTASATVDPATSATSSVAKSTTADLTTSPTTSATAVRVQPTTASLTVTPATAAEATAWKLTANDGSGAVDVSGTWSSEASAWDDNATTYATATGVGVHTLDITGYDFASVVGATDDLVSVVVNVSQYVSDGGRFAAPTVQAFDGSTAIGSPIALLERTAAGSEDVTITGITLAQIRSADFKIRYSVEQTS